MLPCPRSTLQRGVVSALALLSLVLPLLIGPWDASVIALEDAGDAPIARDIVERIESQEFEAALEMARRAAAGARTPRERARFLWLVAETHRSSGDLESAARAFAGLASDATSRMSVEARVEVARCRLAMFDVEGARESLERVPAAHEERATLAALTLLVEGRRREAREALSRMESRNADAWHHLGRLEFERGRNEAALEALEQSRQLQGRDYENDFYHAWSLVRLGQLDAARVELDHLIESAPTAEALELLGRLEGRQEQWEAAAEAFRRALSLNPDFAEAQFGLATALRRLGRTEESRAAFAVFRKLYERRRDAQSRSSRLQQEYRLARDGDSALAVARHALQTGDPETAERFAWTALRLGEGDPRARLTLARSLRHARRHREALVHYRRILKQHPTMDAARSAERELRRMIEEFARPRPAGETER